jgi:plastocyanin
MVINEAYFFPFKRNFFPLNNFPYKKRGKCFFFVMFKSKTTKTNIIMKTTLLLFFALAFCSLQAQQTFDITWMVGISNEDASVTLDVGDTVVWTWGDTQQHSVSSSDPDAPVDFESGILSGMGTTYEYTFTEVAVIDYFCGVHPAMNGTITVEEILSVEEQFIKNLKYYPNPVTDKFHIQSLFPLSAFEVFDLQGRRIMNGPLTGNIGVIDSSTLNEGVYFIALESVNGERATFKIVKN